MANLLRREISFLAKKFNRTNFLSISQSRYYSPKWDTSGDDKFSIISSTHNIEPLYDVTIPEFVWSKLSKFETANAFKCAITGRTYTHRDVYKKSRSFATALLQSGLKRRDIVGIMLPNVPEFPICVYGIWEAGMVQTSINSTYTVNEVAHQLGDTEAKAVITIPQLLPIIKEAQNKCPNLKSIIVIGDDIPNGCHSFYQMANVDSTGTEFLKGSQLEKDELAMLLYSSGTSGPPKGVMLTHSSFATNMLQVSQPGFIATRFFEDGNEQDRLLGMLPFFHVYGLSLVMSVGMYKGAFTICIPKFEPAVFLKAIREHKCTIMHLVPPLIAFMANNPEIGANELSEIRTLVGGAAPISPTLVERLLDKAGKYFFFEEGYGMTELSPVSHLLKAETKNTKIGSCGSVIPGTMCKVVDVETGEALGPNQRGELWIKGPQVMKGYFKNEKATKETINDEGWLMTGDICLYDNDNCFYIVDRKKELIKVKGLQVAPAELEELLRKHPQVLDVAVIGIPDERSGELPRAYIVKKSSNVTEDNLHEFVNSQVAPHKKLKGGIQFLEAIPKAQSGKILRRVLKDAFKDDKFSIISASENINPVVGVTIPEFVFSNLHKFETAKAVKCAITGRTYTYRDIFKKSRSFATALLQSGLKRSDRVGLFLPNLPEYPICIFGIWEAGLIPTSINPTYTATEAAHQLADTEAKAVITIPQFLPIIQEAQKKCHNLKSIIIIGQEIPRECHSFFHMANVDSSNMEFLKGSQLNENNDLAMLLYSSGTSGPPKGVMLTHTNFATNLLQMAQPGYETTPIFEGGNEQSRLLGMLPFFHVYGVSLILSLGMYKGAFTTILPKFEPSTFLKAIREHKCTVMHLVPPLISFMANSSEIGAKELECLQTMVGGAAPVSPTNVQTLLEKAGKYFFFQEGYGMTEMSPVSHILKEETKNTKIGSCGSPVPSTMCKVVDVETGEALGPNQRGELWIKGPQVMKGYFKNEKATKETINDDGWLMTGDICLYDNDNCFYIVDRKKELIKVKGLQVAPAELEELLRKHPQVLDVAVIGIPDERSGELPRAYIVKKSSNVTEDNLHEFVNSQVAPHKKLKGGIQFLEAIPKAQSGKILRRVLKDAFFFPLAFIKQTSPSCTSRGNHQISTINK